jgi:cation-transporting ATPase E
VAALAAAAALFAALVTRRRMRAGRREFASAVSDFGIFEAEGLRGLSQTEAERLAPPFDRAAELAEDHRRFFRRVARASIVNIYSVNLLGNIFVMWALGSPSSAVTSALMLLLNIGIRGLVMLDARRRLDVAMSAIAPLATVIRDGAASSVDRAAVVPGDLIVARPGDEILTAGEIVVARGLTVASLASDARQPDRDAQPAPARPKRVGETVTRSEYCSGGYGVYRAAEPGRLTVAQKEARYGFLPRRPSAFQKVLNGFLAILLALNVAFAVALVVAALSNDASLVSAEGRAAFRLLANIAPTGLFFVLIVSYASGARRIAALGAMTHDTEAIEDLSQVSLVCLSKGAIMSGLTTGVTLLAPDEGPRDAEARRILGDALRSLPIYSPRGARLDESLRGAPRRVMEIASFLREAGWLGATFDEPGFRLTFVMGQPATIRPRLIAPPPPPPAPGDPKPPPKRLMRFFERWNRLLTPLEERGKGRGRRADPADAPEEPSEPDRLSFLCAYIAEPVALRDARGRPRLPRKLIPLARLEVRNDVRSDVRAAIEDLKGAGIDVRLLSPDPEAQTAALAAKLGLDPAHAVSGATPVRQAEVVRSLTAAGHVVALVGNGLGDIPAMRAAACGVALPGPSQAVASLARLVLLDGSLQPLKGALITGQRLVNGALGTLKLNLSQALAVLLMLVVLPRLAPGQSAINATHAGMLALFTIGLPNAVLASWSAAGRLEGAEIRRQLLRFALPIGVSLAVAGVGLFVGYTNRGAPPLYAQLVVAYVLLAAGWVRVLFLLPPNRFWAGASPVRGDPRVTKTVLVVGGIFLVFLLVPFLAGLFDLALLLLRDYVVVTAVVGVWTLTLLAFWRFLWRA